MTDRLVAHDWIITAGQDGGDAYAIAVCRECGESRRASVGEARLPLGGQCDKLRAEREDPVRPRRDP